MFAIPPIRIRSARDLALQHHAAAWDLPPLLVQVWAEDPERLPLARRHLAYLAGDHGWDVREVTEHTGRELPDRPANAAGTWYRHSGTGWSVIAWRSA